jgi:hypothetical protein
VARREERRHVGHVQGEHRGDIRLGAIAPTKNDAQVAQLSQQQDRRTWARSGAIARHEMHRLAEALELAEEPVMGRLGASGLGG